MTDPVTQAIVAIFIAAIVVMVAGTAAMNFFVRRSRLREATRYEDLTERNAVLIGKIADAEGELRRLQQMIAERDRYAAEAAVLQRMIEDLRTEWANLSSAREEIEEVLREAAKAAGEKAQHEKDVADLRREAERLQAELDPDRVERLRKELDELLRDVDRNRTAFDEITEQLDAARRVMSEANSAEARLAMLAAMIAEKEHTLTGLTEEVGRLARESEEKRADMLRLAAEAREAMRERDAALRDHERLTVEATSLQAQIDVLKKLAAGAGLGGTAVAEGSAPDISDLLQEPACLAAPSSLRDGKREESDALFAVQEHLRACGFAFPRRTVWAFHTALKVNDTAQLTVLAGVSGTGKSQLPRRYAEALGIHFLQVAVEPRWDSPQDLLGFYNYVEKKYRATELARLMVHLDPWNSHDLDLSEASKRGHMAMVLLDEMNLARVEYYFSEFLSRLEARPTWAKGLSREAAKDALIPVDIRGLERPPMIYPGHNILFVGTMNDDESTQSLSDKVLDRANVLQFPAPSKFEEAAQTQGKPEENGQSFEEWRGWVRSARSLSDVARSEVRNTIARLSEIMQAFGKPFGHRLNQSMLAYVANYPHERTGTFDPRGPLADQIEFRILPKLRGVPIGSNQGDFDRLCALIRDLGDDQLAERIESLLESQAPTTDLFVWRGLGRDG